MHDKQSLINLGLKFFLIFVISVLLVKTTDASFNNCNNADSLITILNQQKRSDIDSIKFVVEKNIIRLEKQLLETKALMDSTNSERIDTLMEKVDSLDQQIQKIEENTFYNITDFLESVITGTGHDRSYELKRERSVTLKVIDMRYMVVDMQKQELDSLFIKDSIDLRAFEEFTLQMLDNKYDSLIYNIDSK